MELVVGTFVGIVVGEMVGILVGTLVGTCDGRKLGPYKLVLLLEDQLAYLLGY